MTRKNIKIIIIFVVSLILIAVGFIKINQMSYYPKAIVEGENKYKLGAYDLEKSGLSEFQKFIKISESMPKIYTVAYFKAVVDEKGSIQSFTLSLDVFDDNKKYVGLAGYTYASDKLTYSAPKKTSNMLVHTLNPNSTVNYLDEQLRKIPLKQQIKASNLKHYVLCFQPYTQIESGTPILDGRNNTPFPVLTREEYNNGKGGVSDGKTNVVFRLYDGTSIATGQQYLYVFEPLEKETATGNQLSHMECDYYINQGTLKITRDYGESWIDAGITKEELGSTMKFYRNNLAIPPQSIYISSDKTMPVAYFYGKNPKLKILPNNTNVWKTMDFPTAEDFGREITKRAVGFVTPDFGYAALGTDWSMGGGENKMCYFTSDGGVTWDEKSLPMQGTSNMLIDLCMANEKEGAVSLVAGMDADFPMIYVTADTANEWTQIELPFSDMPEEVQYLADIESFEYSDGTYTLTLGQEDDGTNKAVFTSGNLVSGWKFSKAYQASVHTVG